MSPSLQPPYT
uniref:Uncharacterized protein n=1 Tax=Arundo donax TaxID=35708 RepID=A0A0A9B1K0_ARUDO